LIGRKKVEALLTPRSPKWRALMIGAEDWVSDNCVAVAKYP